MQTRHPTRLAGAAVAALALVAAAGATTPKWTLLPGVPLPAGAANSQLRDVAAVSAQDVWSAGAWWDKVQVHPMLAHWDGAAWKTPDLPALPQDTYLSGVDAVGAADVWAVGSTVAHVAQSSPATPSVLHYDGSAWQTVPTPALPAGSNDLDAIDMRTASDGWAVGETSTGALTQPLIVRWQGGKWIDSPVPKSVLGTGGLVAVAASAADDVWAVGTQADVNGPSGAGQGLVLHFDGAAWSPVKLPTPAGTTLDAVAVAGPGDVWAAGKTCSLTCTAAVWHLTASGWQPVPTVGGTETNALVVFAPDNVWALGYQLLLNNAKGDHVEHWDGKKFTAEDTGLPPIPSSASNQGELGSATPIFAAAGDPASGELWAVGWSDPPTIMPRAIHRG
jgi:hypothetical protein